MYKSLLGIADNAWVSKVRRINNAVEITVRALVVECVYPQDVSPKEEQVGFIRNTCAVGFLRFIGEDSEALVVGLHEKAIEGIVCLRYTDVQQVVCSEISQAI